METSQTYKGKAIINVLVFILAIAINAMAEILPMNGKTTGQLSDQYSSLFTPAPITFSIWSVIYLLLLGFVVYQAIVLSKPDHPAQKQVLKITPLFIVNCLANAAWMVAWHYEQLFLSVVIMFVLLISLILIHERTHLARPWRPFPVKMWLDIPFSIYLGWISIATIANVSCLLVAHGWNGAGISAVTWTLLMVGVGTLLSILVLFIRKNIFFPLVISWAIYGISLKRTHDTENGTINLLFFCWICIAIILLCVLIELMREKTHPIHG